MRPGRGRANARRPWRRDAGRPTRHTAHYLVQFRFQGVAKEMIRDLAYNLRRHFVRPAERGSESRVVPHISLAGPLTTNDERSLVDEVVNACRRVNRPVKFKLDGFGTFNNNVIFVRINPSAELISLQQDIAERLDNFCVLRPHDLKLPFPFHSTLYMDRGGIKNFDKVWEFVNTFVIPPFDLYLARVTILKDGLILREYDLILDKILDRGEALDAALDLQTNRRLAKIAEPPAVDFLEIDDQEQVYLISDLHFDHANIIRLCNRPFDNIDEMNGTMLKNWTRAAGDHSTVFFLGDMTFGRDRRPIDFWLQKLTGNIRFLRGNHDQDIVTTAKVIPAYYGIRYKGREFLLAHHPYRPDGYEGWFIHGHVHNRDLNLYPLVNQKKKTANVSAELVDYTPISLDHLNELIDTGRKHPALGRGAAAR